MTPQTTIAIHTADARLRAEWAACLRAAGHAVADRAADVNLIDADTIDPTTIPAPRVVAAQTVTAAFAAGRAGAAAFVPKPATADQLLAAITAATPPAKPILGDDPHMRRVFDLVDAVAPGRTTVLITGESGTGKSVLARAVHAASPRRDRPFVEVSCGSLPDALLESELFGHVKGAFTGAHADRPGRFLAADGGTIFLDEINSAPPAMQVKLLRVLQTRQFEPVGSTATRTADVRVVLASNADLPAMVAAGTFRQDLFYRINVVPIHLPPLRDRPADVPLLAERFLQHFRAECERPAAVIGDEAMAALIRHPWPGNVRELENAIERAVVLCRSATITVADLPDAVRTDDRPVTVPAAAVPAFDAPLPLSAALEQPERRLIQEALRHHTGNRQRTADALGINRTTLYKKMLKFGID